MISFYRSLMWILPSAFRVGPERELVKLRTYSTTWRLCTMNNISEYIVNESIKDAAERQGVDAVSADVYADHALVYLAGGQIATIEASMRSDWAFGDINTALRNESIPALCWRFRWMGGDVVEWVAIENESAQVHAESVVWDDENMQLVAAVFAGDRQISKAIMATLMTNSEKIKAWIKRDYSRIADLVSARRRYTQVSRSLAEANASGTAVAVLHPLAGNPWETAAAHFYVVSTPGESLVCKFRERLDMALSLSVLPEWAEYLLDAGRKAGLVIDLEKFGPTFFGLRVSKMQYGEKSWESVISAGLRSGLIQL